MSQNKDDGKNINKALLILSSFDEASPMQRTTDIASRLGMNMSTASRHLNTLFDLGFLTRDDATGQYRLGLKMISLAGAALQNSVVYRYSYPELQKLSFQHNIHSHMSVPWNTDVMHIISTSCEKNKELFMPMGHCHPMYCSAMGRVILAYKPEDEVERILRKSDLKKYTNETKVEVPEIMRSLKEIRKSGYAIVIDELDMGVGSIAAPILNRMRDPVGAISVSASEQRIRSTIDEEKALIKAVVTAAGRISAKRGFFPK